MRYVGRHRAARPLLLRRPVAGGVAAAVALVVPVLYVSGNFGPGIKGSTPTNQIAEGKTKGPTPAGAKAETGKNGVVIPVDDDPAVNPANPQVPGNANPGVVATGIPVGGGVGPSVPVVTKSPRPGATKSPTVAPTVRPTQPTRPPTTTTKPPVVEPKPSATSDPPKPPTTTNPPKPPTTTTNPPKPDPPKPDPKPDPPTPTGTGTGAGTGIGIEIEIGIGG
jgi:hypothetical protein